MNADRSLSDPSIDAIAAAVFAKPDPVVLEAYSEPDQLPRSFTSAAQLANYVRSQLSHPKGLAYVFVVYPDMGGSPTRRTINLDPAVCPGHKVRYTWDGFGLIALQLQNPGGPMSRSRICANSHKRAAAWASTYPEWKQPNEWNWKAVESHTRRLERVLKKVCPVA